jgi:hypothetical protein
MYGRTCHEADTGWHGYCMTGYSAAMIADNNNNHKHKKDNEKNFRTANACRTAYAGQLRHMQETGYEQ